jgi:hypothetical protein
LLHEGGINEYEDPEQPLPKGHVQVMTIHLAEMQRVIQTEVDV